MRTTQPDLTDKELIDAIRAGGSAREHAWRYITENWGAYCCNTARKVTDCTKQTSIAAYSYAVVGVDGRIQSTIGYDFLRSASLKTYLTASTINGAKGILKLGKKHNDVEDEDANLPGEDLGVWFRRQQCRDIMEKVLTGIGDRCKKILLMFNDGFSMKEIAEEMGFENEKIAKSEKYKCQVKFIAHLLKNPADRNLLELNCYG